MQVRYAPDVEIEYDSDFEALGMSGTFRGHEGQLKMVDTLDEAWERWEMLPAIVLDLGDRALVLGTVRLPGNVSGVELEREQAQLLTLRGALVAHEQFFFGGTRGCEPPDSTRAPSLFPPAERRVKQRVAPGRRAA